MTPAEQSDPRRFTRLLFQAPARLTTPHLAPRLVQVQDISLKGALIHLPDAWQGAPGENCTLEIPLSPGEALIRMEGRIAHVEGKFVGIHCLSLDLDSITHLRRLVELNLGETALLEREVAALVSE